MRKNSNGNALWLILIMIALLGFLTAVISRSSGTVDQAGSFEQNRISASKILNTAKSLETAVQQLLNNGCSENEISFENSTVSGYTNAGSPSDERCNVFAAAGAGLSYQKPLTQWLDKAQSAQSGYQEWVFTAGNYIVGVETGTDALGDADASNKELAVMLPYVNETLCKALNDLAGVSNPSGAPPQDNGTAALSPKYTGSFTAGESIQDTASGTDALDGKETGCFEGGGTPATGTYHFYHVLIAR